MPSPFGLLAELTYACPLHYHMQISIQSDEPTESDRIAGTPSYDRKIAAARLVKQLQLERAETIVRAERERLRGRMEITYVLPDYYSKYPKPCMGGWAHHQLTVAPNGDALPCPAAQTLPLPRANVHELSLAWIWTESPLFQRFRHGLVAEAVRTANEPTRPVEAELTPRPHPRHAR